MEDEHKPIKSKKSPPAAKFDGKVYITGEEYMLIKKARGSELVIIHQCDFFPEEYRRPTKAIKPMISQKDPSYLGR